MNPGWREHDLEGGGLQAANLILARRLKRARRAYALLAFAPLGLHRRYLESPRAAWAWRAAALVVVGLASWQREAGLAGAAVFAVAVVAEAFWIDRRVTALNKRIRKEVYLSQGAVPPPGYQGRNPDAGGRVPSFAEQERLLREIEVRRRGSGPGPRARRAGAGARPDHAARR